MKAISVHIPKTGGQTLIKYYLAAFGDQNHVPIPCKPSNDPTSELYGDRGNVQAMFREYARELDVDYVCLHVPVWAWYGLYPGVPRITFMRDPMTRIISSYFFAHRINKIPPEMGIYDFMEMPSRTNWQSWYMDGSIDKFDFIGFQETFGDDVKYLFSSVLGLKVPSEIEPVNVATDTVYFRVRDDLKKDRMFIRQVKKLNKNDYQLYKEAWAKWKNNTPLKIIS